MCRHAGEIFLLPEATVQDEIVTVLEKLNLHKKINGGPTVHIKSMAFIPRVSHQS